MLNPEAEWPGLGARHREKRAGQRGQSVEDSEVGRGQAAVHGRGRGEGCVERRQGRPASPGGTG